jgi:uncharacterized protein (TIGR02147 family)
MNSFFENRASAIWNLLWSEFERRKKKNSQYSLKSFSRDLGISYPHFTRFLKGDRGFSETTVAKICMALDVAAADQHKLVAEAVSLWGRAESQKRRARVAAQKGAVKALNESEMNALSEWQAVAILECVGLPDFQGGESDIARRLGLQVKACKGWVAKLVQVGLLWKNIDGRLVRADGFFQSTDGVSSAAVRTFHRNVIEQALKRLDSEPVRKRDLSTTVMAIAHDDFPRAQTLIREFADSLSARLPNRKNAVYSLGIQLIRLDCDT